MRVTRAQLERNLVQKQSMPEFLGDVLPLLADATSYEPSTALALIRRRLVERLPGKPWKKAPRES